MEDQPVRVEYGAAVSSAVTRAAYNPANPKERDGSKLELAIALFANERLSLGKAAELAAVSVGEFQLHLGRRRVSPHYCETEAQEDAATLAALRGS